LDLKDFESLGLTQSMMDVDFDRTVNGRSNISQMQRALSTEGDRQYHLNPEAFPAEGTAQGHVVHHAGWAGGRCYPGVARDLWIYTPPAFDPKGPAPAVMVFQDGGFYVDPAGLVRAPAVFDSLTAAGEMGPTIGVFVAPGQAPDAFRQRSIEYDTVSEAYGRFLIEDVLPFVESEIGCALSADPARRTVCGISSGGICAFTAAWFRPESFGRVMSHCGSFLNLRGGHHFPYLARTTPRKPIRVWLQSGAGDADLLFGSWPLANQEMAAALAYAGYDVRFVFGEGGHSLHHGGAVFADALRWLWRAEPLP
jgi:enterochelin esterase family protein